jgi:methionine-R-sulfoxide reductase
MVTIGVALGVTAGCALARKPAQAAAPAPPAAADGAFGKRLSDAQLEARKKELPPDVFAVTQKEATEPSFHNAYWDNHAPGIYVDVVSGEPLFSSLEKFDSGTGWPSFWAPLEKHNVVTHNDPSLGMDRTEVRSRVGNSHLGHVFPDGPAPTHQRYCMDSASLRFIPAERLTVEGYSDYAHLFPSVTQAKK